MGQYIWQTVPTDLAKGTKHISMKNVQQPTNCLSVLDHFVGLALKGLC